MSKFINKANAITPSPLPDNDWVKKSNIERKKLIQLMLNKKKEFTSFQVIEANDNGNVILRIEKNIQPEIRGPLLLDLECLLKNSIDESITIWLEPVGDKSKLRKLRGIEIKSEK